MLNRARVLGGFAVIPTGETLLRQHPRPVAAAQALRAALAATRRHVDDLNRALDDVGVQMRDRRMMWSSIGRHLGVSPPLARQRVTTRRRAVTAAANQAADNTAQEQPAA